MLRVNRKLWALALSLVIMLAAVAPASAQSWRRDRRDRLSGGEKTAIIGGSAVAGAVIGGLLGGKKGAVIGGLLGAGGGTGVVVYKDQNDNDRYGRNWRYRNYRNYDGRFYDGRFNRFNRWHR